MVSLAAEELGPEIERLLERVRKGEAITLTRDGQAVALLSPISEALENLRRLQREAEAAGGAAMTDEQIDALIAEVRLDRRRRGG